jgi:hypothetical protein
MKPATILVRSKNFVQRQLGEETVLVPISQTGVDVQNIYTLNETAAMVWKLLENKCTEEDVVAAIEQEYTADIDVIRKDVQDLIAEFIQESFVNVVKE